MQRESHTAGAPQGLDHGRLSELLTGGAIEVENVFRAGVVAAAYRCTRRLFGAEERIALAADSPFAFGFMPYGRALAGDTRRPNLLEAWTINLDAVGELPIPEVDDERVRGIGVELRRLAKVVLQAMAAEPQRGLLVESWAALVPSLLAIHYPERLLSEDSSGVRQSEHVDGSMFSVLTAASCGGLQIMSPDGTWTDYSFPDTSALVMIGEALEILTSGAVRPCRHRVRRPLQGEPLSRLSFVYFVPPASAGLNVGAMHAQSVIEEQQHAYFRDRFAW